MLCQQNFSIAPPATRVVPLPPCVVRSLWPRIILTKCQIHDFFAKPQTGGAACGLCYYWRMRSRLFMLSSLNERAGKRQSRAELKNVHRQQSCVNNQLNRNNFRAHAYRRQSPWNGLVNIHTTNRNQDPVKVTLCRSSRRRRSRSDGRFPYSQRIARIIYSHVASLLRRASGASLVWWKGGGYRVVRM